MRVAEDPQAVVAAAVEAREVPGAVAVYGTREGTSSIGAHGFARLAGAGREASAKSEKRRAEVQRAGAQAEVQREVAQAEVQRAGAQAEVRRVRSPAQMHRPELHAQQPAPTPGAEVPEEMHAQTLFDLASLTKVVATLPSILALLSDGRISLEDRTGDFFPFAQGAAARLSLRSLLSHSSGLPASLPLYREVGTVANALSLILGDTLELEPGKYVYSDLGFITLGAVVEEVSGQGLEEFASERVFRPLGMVDTGFGPVVGRQVAATENCPWRGRVMQGEVHDENAFALGGVCGHAGLFGTAEDLAKYALAWLRLDERLGPERLLNEAVSEQLEQNGVRRGLGWQLAGENSSVGPLASSGAFGHTGFTGTSLWCDPVQGWFAVLLTNRVHPQRDDGARIHRLRRRFHEAVARAVAS
ncbi:MAG TPA: serine hydrolase [Trueperaceae bacterium]